MTVKQALTSFRAPDEREAEDRAWTAVRSAYAQRERTERRRSHRRSLFTGGTAALLAGAVALSPAGATVGRLIGRALGVQHATPALFPLPAPGRLLVSGSGGTWTVAADGTTRRIGPWTQASWSPHGRYVTVAGRDRLAAVNGRGTALWALSAPAVSDPEWYAPSGYRVAYLSGRELRVVAGDGTGDHLLAAPVAPVTAAWRPGSAYELAYVTAGHRLVVCDADTGATVWAAAGPGAGSGVRRLAWSADGRRLLAVSADGVSVYDSGGRLRFRQRGVPIIDGAISPDGDTLALITGDDVTVENTQVRDPTARRVLAGTGLDQVAWSPDGRWLLVSWPAANQWVFVRVIGTPQIRAVSRIAQQFSGRSFPRLEGWCCTP